MQSLIPNLAVNNVTETIEYYQNNLGFELLMCVDQARNSGNNLNPDTTYIWAMIKNGDVEIMLQEANSIKEEGSDFFENIGASVSFYIAVEDVNTFYQEVSDKVEIYREPETTWYGQREFYVRDINGYILGFASTERPFEG